MKFTAGFIACLSLVLAHPGHEEAEHQLAYKRHFNAQARRGLAACNEILTKRGVHQRAQERRAATIQRYRRAYGLHARDTSTVINTSHLSNESYTPETAETTIFGTSNTCVVNPEGETGPYWVKGEYIRSNLRESQTGVPIVIEGQFLDIETCSPLTNVWWDIWNCNATGVYGGVVEQGNGNTADTSNINATFLRGIQQADSDGVVTFESIFPGHYSGRATHHHMVVHLDPTVADNNTLVGGSYAHVGQVFWDQDLIDKVEATSPYSSNTVAVTKNADDRVFSTETTDTTSDPVFEYVYLGDDLSDGLFGWITIVVNTSATYDPNYSFALTSSGGESQSGGSMSVDGGTGGSGGSGGPPSGGNSTMSGGNSTMSGSPPSGSGAPSGTISGSPPSGSVSGGAIPAGSGSVTPTGTAAQESQGSGAPSGTGSAGAPPSGTPSGGGASVGNSATISANAGTISANAATTSANAAGAVSSASDSAAAASSTVVGSSDASRSALSPPSATTTLLAVAAGSLAAMAGGLVTSAIGGCGTSGHASSGVGPSGRPSGMPDGQPGGLLDGVPCGMSNGLPRNGTNGGMRGGGAPDSAPLGFTPGSSPSGGLSGFVTSGRPMGTAVN